VLKSQPLFLTIVEFLCVTRFVYINCRFKVLQDGKVKIGLEFWFNPVWLLVDETTSSSYCIDSEVNESNISGSTKRSGQCGHAVMRSLHK